MDRVSISIDGVDLESAGIIAAPGLCLQSVPARRDVSVVVPGRHGVLHGGVEDFESRDMAISVVVMGADAQGNVPSGQAGRELFERNLGRLLSLLSRRGAPLSLRRNIPGRGEATAEGRVVDAISPSLINGRAANVVVTVEIPGVFWRSDVATEQMPGVTVPGSRLTLPKLAGTVDIDDAVLTLKGPTAGNPRITDDATGSWVELSRQLGEGETWEVDCRSHTSKVNGVDAQTSASSWARMITLRSKVLPNGEERCSVTISTTHGGFSVTARKAEY